MQKVFILFEAYGDPDGWVQFDAIGVFSCADRAYDQIPKYDGNLDDVVHKREDGSEWVERPRSRLIHESMTRENKISYRGKRDDCSRDWGDITCYVIEEVVLDELIHEKK